jgi:hypothetical protein
MLDEEDDFGSDPDVIEGTAVTGIETDRVHRRLLAWVREIVDSVEEEAPLRFRLSQVTHLGGDRPVRTIRFAFDKDCEKCVDAIIGAAIDDIEGGNFRGKIAYNVALENTEDQSFNFMLEVPRGNSNEQLRRRHYLPDMPGLTAQLMEQNLQLTDKALDAAGSNTALLRGIIKDLQAEIAFLKKGSYERDQQVQKLMDGSLKRTMMYEEHQSKLKREETFAEAFKEMAPPILAQLAGPQAAAMAATMLQGKMKNLQLPGFAGGASDEDLIDEVILDIERVPAMRDEIMAVFLRHSPSTLENFGELHKRSAARREERARQQAEEAQKNNEKKSAA